MKNSQKILMALLLCFQQLNATNYNGRRDNQVIQINAGEFIYNTEMSAPHMFLVYDNISWGKGNHKGGFYITQPKDWDQQSDITINLKFHHSNNIATPTTVDWVLHLLPLNPDSGDSLLGYQQASAVNPVIISTNNLNAVKSQKFTIPANQFLQHEIWGIFFERGFESVYSSDETFDGYLEVLKANVTYTAMAEPAMRNMIFSAGAINREMDREPGDASIEERFDNALRWNKDTPSNNREGGIRFRVPNDWNHSISERKATIYFATASPDTAQTVNWRARYTSYEAGDSFPMGSLEVTGDQPIAIPAGGYGRVYSQTFDLPTTYLHDLAEIYFARGTAKEGESHSNPLRVLAIDVSYPVSEVFHDYVVDTINPAGLTLFQHINQEAPVTMVTQDYALFPKNVYHPSYWHLEKPPMWDDQSDVLFRVFFETRNNPNTAFGAVHWSFRYQTGDELVFINSQNAGKLLHQDFCVPNVKLNQSANWKIHIGRDVNSVYESYDDDLHLIAISKVHKQVASGYIFAAGFEANLDCQAQKALLD